MKVTKENLPLVWMRLTGYLSVILEESDSATAAFCVDLTELLDRMAEQDALGTEGQNDPGGDQRND